MRTRAFVAAFLIGLAGSSAAAGPAGPGPKDRCPVCGMFVAKYPDFAARVVLEDGASLHFDGVKDLVRFWRNPSTYSRSRAAVRAVFVKDYYSLSDVDGRQAYYVLGSDVLGPMGKELIPFGTKESADEFMKDHKGQRVLRFPALDDRVLRELE